MAERCTEYLIIKADILNISAAESGGGSMEHSHTFCITSLLAYLRRI
jgi:hypothetical protein